MAASIEPQGTPRPGSAASVPRRGRWSLSDRQLASLLVLPTAIILLALQLYPFLSAAYDSFFNTSIYTGDQIWVGLQNFSIVLQDPSTHDAFVRTVVFVVAVMTIAIVSGMIAAMTLNAGLRGQTIARGLAFFPYMVPALVAAMAFRLSLNEVYGIVNYLLVSVHLIKQPIPFLSDPHTILLTVVIVYSWKFIPLMTIVLLARLQTLPRDFLEAARVDGATRLRTFWHVTLPWVMPVLLVAGLLQTIWAATEFDTPYLVAFGGPLEGSTTVAIQIRALYLSDLQIGQACALALFMAVFLAIASFLYLRVYRNVERSSG
jgi:multiple sugar transport system permease protein